MPFPRRAGSTRSGGSFTPAEIQAVWNKGRVLTGHDSTQYRVDNCGKLMVRSAYGTTGDYGWEIDHIKPIAVGGGDELSNLQPLNWKTNRHKSDSYPTWFCPIAA